MITRTAQESAPRLRFSVVDGKTHNLKAKANRINQAGQILAYLHEVAKLNLRHHQGGLASVSIYKIMQDSSNIRDMETRKKN